MARVVTAVDLLDDCQDHDSAQSHGGNRKEPFADEDRRSEKPEYRQVNEQQPAREFRQRGDACANELAFSVHSLIILQPQVRGERNAFAALDGRVRIAGMVILILTFTISLACL